ncbi:hypothetical protein NL532_24350 [Mesorhizobium sp. C120A]|uniref:hypothetical protein n=1 Tax=unclassified Mesorhizobium TaxID=325217 RepID=UPI0003D0186C|nr:MULTISPECIES: hypothetical protein [unclassified Mesorhizobium]ESZ60693.1 hypothetical protein X728_15310 [Mesorhizobium sp. L103C120A0]WJI43741.1 hypothetical protein NL532_24350 [Mesorhizobium sp. C120A]
MKEAAELIARLRRDIVRLREEATLDDRASSTSSNPDAAPVFAAWAAAKGQRADDIESLIGHIETLAARVAEARSIIEVFAPLCDEGSRAHRFLEASR